MNDVDMSAICRYIKDQGLTRRKLCLAAAQRDELLKLQYSTDFFVYECEMLTFVDETEADKRNLLRKHANSIRGRPLSPFSKRRTYFCNCNYVFCWIAGCRHCKRGYRW